MSRPLIDKKSHQSTLFKDSGNLRRSPLFGNKILSRRLSKILDKPVQIRIVQRSGNGMRRIGQHTERKAANFKIAEMSRYQYHRTVLMQQTQQRLGIDQLNMIRPIEISDLPPSKCHFNSHQEQMFPHCPNDKSAFLLIKLRKSNLQIFMEQPTSDRQNPRKNKRQPASKSLVCLQTQRLDNTKQDSDKQINKIIAKRTEHQKQVVGTRKQYILPQFQCPAIRQRLGLNAYVWDCDAWRSLR
jgi:hypothetical protein